MLFAWQAADLFLENPSLKPDKPFINKLLSTLLMLGAIGYYIPKTIDMFHWTDSGVIRAYFYLLAPVNLLLIIVAALSMLSFHKKHNQAKSNMLLGNNLVGIIAMIAWFPLINSG